MSNLLYYYSAIQISKMFRWFVFISVVLIRYRYQIHNHINVSPNNEPHGHLALLSCLYMCKRFTHIAMVTDQPATIWPRPHINKGQNNIYVKTATSLTALCHPVLINIGNPGLTYWHPSPVSGFPSCSQSGAMISALMSRQDHCDTRCSMVTVHDKEHVSY